MNAHHFNLIEPGVPPDHQRHGIGRALVEHLIDVLRVEGRASASSLITTPNQPGRAVLRSVAGFTSRSRAMMGYVVG